MTCKRFAHLDYTHGNLLGLVAAYSRWREVPDLDRMSLFPWGIFRHTLTLQGYLVVNCNFSHAPFPM